MAGRKGDKQLRAIIEAEGIDIRAISVAGSGHTRFELTYGTNDFIVVTGNNTISSDRRKATNFRADIRNIKRALDTKDPTLIKKYLGDWYMETN